MPRRPAVPYWTVPVSYPQRHHPRLAGYDYQTPGYYFVTLCTQHRLPLFGSVEAGQMHRSEAGEMVHTAWRDLVDLHSGIAVDTLITMQDHVHALVVLEDDPRRTLSLSDVIHRYKSLTTKRYTRGVREQDWPRFEGRLWQESFYDRVLRRQEQLEAAPRYIVENPQRYELRRLGEE